MVFVHGIGGQRKSDTLLDLGDPLFHWLQRWYAAYDHGEDVRVGRTELSFAAVDVGQADIPPWSRIEFTSASTHGASHVTGPVPCQARRWSLVEVWWAESNRKPDLATMLYWSWIHLWDVVAQLIRSVAERFDRLLHPAGHPSQPAGWIQAIDLLNCLGLLIIYPLLAVVGYVVLIPLVLVAQVPIGAFQDWVLLRLVQPLLLINVGEFRMFLDDELQAANVRRRAADAVDWLVQHENCREVTIVAHSEGAVVSFGMLTDPEFASTAASVRKFITLGAGLNKSWLIRPELKRLHGPLHADNLWLDFWASFDPVPAGKLDPPPGVRMYAPTGAAAAQLGGSTDPINLQVTNEMHVLTDHGGYWRNDEQVLSRMVAEIDAEDHTTSLFWVGDWNGAARARRARVSILAAVRALAVLGTVLSSVSAWIELAEAHVGPWTSLTAVRPPPDWLAAPIAVLSALDSFARTVLPPLAGLIQQILALPAYVGSAALLAICWWAAYRLISFALWNPWDRRARDAAVRSAALTARGSAAQ